MFWTLILVAILSLLSLGSALGCNLTPVDLMVEFRSFPVGIQSKVPRLGWKLQGDAQLINQQQASYQIRCFSRNGSQKADIWDSGRILGNNSIQIPYGGSPLSSNQKVFWAVTVWDENDASCVSEQHWWQMGLLLPTDWTGSWIGRQQVYPPPTACDFYNVDPTPLLRYQFSLRQNASVVSATLHISGLGFYELYLDGTRVGEKRLDPGQTDYRLRVLYSSYDVTTQLTGSSSGPHALAVELGNGWYNPLPLLMWGGLNIRNNLAVGQPKLLLQLSVSYSDGVVQQIDSGPAWKVGNGATIHNSIYLGEIYDARLDTEGWMLPGFDDSAWPNAVKLDAPGGALQAQPQPPIVFAQDLLPVAITKPHLLDKLYIVDLGKNFAGVVTLRVHGKAGDAVVMRYGEVLYADGTLNVMTSVAGQIKHAGMGGPCAPDVAFQTDTFILRGTGQPEEFTPKFTWHGFRYVEVNMSAFDYPLTADMITGHVLHANVTSAVSFTSSVPILDQVFTMWDNTLLSNLMSVQSDCPARERFGYGGDLLGTCEGGMMSYDLATMYEKRIHDFNDDVRSNGGFTETAPYNGIADNGFGDGSGPVLWGSVQPQLSMYLYRYYGNLRIVQESYAAAQQYVSLLQSNINVVQNGLSDWMGLEPSPVALTGMGGLIADLLAVADMASVLNDSPNELKYRNLAQQFTAQTNSAFLDVQTGVYSQPGHFNATQCAQAMPLAMGLAPQGAVNATLNVLLENIAAHKGHLTVGLFGMKWLLQTLASTGHQDIAVQIMTQQDYPSFGYMMSEGATTIWESWSYSDSTFSHNHPMFGGGAALWLVNSVLGIAIDPQAVGFDRVVIAPRPSGALTSASGAYNSIRGAISNDWSLTNGKFQLKTCLPPGILGTVDLTGVGELLSMSEGVQMNSFVEQHAVMRIGSGCHTVTAIMY